jgi:hypothetical protein
LVLRLRLGVLTLAGEIVPFRGMVLRRGGCAIALRGIAEREVQRAAVIAVCRSRPGRSV